MGGVWRDRNDCSSCSDQAGAAGALEVPTKHWLGEGGSVFSKFVAPDKLAILWCKATHPIIFEQHKLDLIIFYKEIQLGG